MITAREEILARIRAANAAAGAAPAPRPEAPVDDRAGDVDLFCANVADYRADVRRAAAGAVAGEVAAALAEHDVRSLIVPDGLAEAWLAELPPGLRLRRVDAASAPSPAELDAIDAVVTSATVGIARTGTIVLDHGPGQGVRALTLVPDVHVCVIAGEQVVADLPGALARIVRGDATDRPLTWISGPSATSDIELTRVEGVHGPRTLVVVVIV